MVRRMARLPEDLTAQIAANKRRATALVAGAVALVVVVLTLLGAVAGSALVGLVVGVVAGAVVGGAAWTRSTSVALSLAGAAPADEEQHARLHNLVEGLCAAAGLPKPALYVVADAAPDAFAVGRGPRNAAVVCTAGLLDGLTRMELEGVLAHELSHVKNYDILVSTIAVTAVGAVALLADIGLRFMFWGGMREGRRDNNDAGALGAVLAIGALALLALAPIIAQLMQFAMSRRREYLADASGVQLTRYPPGLVSALEKLRDDQAVVHHATRATAQLWIESPLDRGEGKKGSWLNRAFDTHPPLEDRIKVLKEM